MADKFVIPKFREKIIHWKTADTGTEVSYPVSGSFKGILRLSPNDDLTLQEQNGITLFDENIESFYSDSIANDIVAQFVRVSSSDGYFVNLRFTQYDIEADSMYVIGVSHHNVLRLYARQENAFKLKNLTAMPSRVNTISTALVDSEKYVEQDIPGVDMTAPLDQSYILVSRNLQERRFEYQQATAMIRELVVESMLDLCTLPPGSIHYVPITIAEYEKMVIKGNPNAYFKLDNVTPNDPIVRDFLICDGSLYKNEDFPELAKILEGERIDYWRFDTKKNKMVVTTYTNDYSKVKNFRVPDLRCRFLKSLKLQREYWNAEWNQTGGSSCDSRPLVSESVVDHHTHFVASGMYLSTYENKNYAKVADINDKGQWYLTKKPGVLAPENNFQSHGYGVFGQQYEHNGGEGCRTCPTDSNTMQYFLSIPQNYDYQEINLVPNVCLSSVDMVACLEQPTKDEDVSYNENTDYAPYVGTGAENSYGKENTPEFYCALPLIKI